MFPWVLLHTECPDMRVVYIFHHYLGEKKISTFPKLSKETILLILISAETMMTLTCCWNTKIWHTENSYCTVIPTNKLLHRIYSFKTNPSIVNWKLLSEMLSKGHFGNSDSCGTGTVRILWTNDWHWVNFYLGVGKVGNHLGKERWLRNPPHGIFWSWINNSYRVYKF